MKTVVRLGKIKSAENCIGFCFGYASLFIFRRIAKRLCRKIGAIPFDYAQFDAKHKTCAYAK